VASEYSAMWMIYCTHHRCVDASHQADYAAAPMLTERTSCTWTIHIIYVFVFIWNVLLEVKTNTLG